MKKRFALVRAALAFLLCLDGCVRDAGCSCKGNFLS